VRTTEAASAGDDDLHDCLRRNRALRHGRKDAVGSESMCG